MNFKVISLLLLLASPAFAIGPSAYGVQNTISAGGSIADCAASAASGPSAINTALAVQFSPSAFLSGSISGGGVPDAFGTAAFQISSGNGFSGAIQFGVSIDGVTWNAARGVASQAPPAISVFATATGFPLAGELIAPFGAKWACVYATSVTSGTAFVQMEPSVAHSTLLLGSDGPAARLVATDNLGRLVATALPIQTTGSYRINATTSGYAGLGAGSILMSLRYAPGGGGIAAITRVRCFVTTATAATAAGRLDRALFIVRNFTVSDTGGAAVSLASPAGKLRSTHAASGMADFRVFSGAITAGTGTQDANPVDVIATEGTATEPVGLTLPAQGASTDLFNYQAGQNYPIVLAPNEGLRITIPTAMPASIVQKTSCTFEWYEPVITTGF